MAAMNAVAPHLLPPGSTAGAGAGANGSTAGVPIAASGSAVVTVAANPTPGGAAMAHAAPQQQQEAPEVRRREPLHPHHLLPQQKRQQQQQSQPQLQQRLQVPKLESTNGHHGLASAIPGSTPAPPASAPAPTPVIAVAAAAARSAAPAAATIALPTIQVTPHSSSPRGVKRPRESLSPQQRVHGVEGGASDLGSASAPSSVRGGAASTTSDTQQTVDTVDMDDGVSHAMVRAPVNLVSSCVQTIAEAMPDAHVLFLFFVAAFVVTSSIWQPAKRRKSAAQVQALERLYYGGEGVPGNPRPDSTKVQSVAKVGHFTPI